MRTTVRLDEGLLLRAKRHAAETRRTLTQLIADSLVSTMEREAGASSPRKVKLRVYCGDGVFEGVDINRSASVLQAMERAGGQPS